jgi:hypothetical protein
MMKLLVLGLMLVATAADAKPPRDRAADRDTRCEANPLPSGAGIDGCPRLLDEDRWPQAELRYDPPPASAAKPLWVPPLAPGAQR